MTVAIEDRLDHLEERIEEREDDAGDNDGLRDKAVVLIGSAIIALFGGALPAWISTQVQLARYEERQEATIERIERVESQMSAITHVSERLARIEQKVDSMSARISRGANDE